MSLMMRRTSSSVDRGTAAEDGADVGRGAGASPHENDCAMSCLSGIGWGADLLTVSVHILDVALDVTVAVEFYTAHRFIYFYCVMASLMLSTICYASAGLTNAVRLPRCLDVLPSVPRFFVLLALGPLLPVVVWFYHATPFLKQFEQNCMSDGGTGAHNRGSAMARSASSREPTMTGLSTVTTSSSSSALSRVSPPRRPRAAASVMVVADVMRHNPLTSAMMEGFESYWRSHVFFVFETLVESGPQMVIQLLAASESGTTPSAVQLVSLCFSTLSILMKSYLLARSSDVRVALWKAACLMWDIIVTFYCFASLLSERDYTGQTTIYFGRRWTALQAAWLVKLVFLSIFCVLVAVNMALVVITGYHTALVKLLGVLICFVGIIPLVMLGETFKLSWFALGVQQLDVRLGTSIGYRLFTFVSSGDFDKRSQFVVRCIERAYRAPNRDELLYRGAYDDDVRVAKWRTVIRAPQHAAHEDAVAPSIVRRPGMSYTFSEDVVVFFYHTVPSWVLLRPHKDPPRPAALLIGTCAVIVSLLYIVLSILNAFYPIVDVLAFTRHGLLSLNVLETGAFWSSVIVGVGAAVLILRARDYWRFLLMVREASAAMLASRPHAPYPGFDEAVLMEYFLPVPSASLAACIPEACIPRVTVCHHLASWLAEEDAAARSMSVEECLQATALKVSVR